MARLTARIKRLEAREGARAGGEFAHLSDAELEARICAACGIADQQLRDMRRGMSVADIEAETGWSADDPRFAALFAEAQAPAFDAARFLAALAHPRN